MSDLFAAGVWNGIMVMAGLAAAAAVVHRGGRARAKVELAALRGAAETLGLTCERSFLGLRGGTIFGPVEGFFVRIVPAQHRETHSGGMHTVEAISYTLAGVPSGFGFSRPGFSSELLQFVTGPDVQTGDDGFDRSVVVRGEERELRATLDAMTRGAIHKILYQPADAAISSGTIRILIASVPQSSDEIVRQIRELLTLAKRLSVPPSEIPARLAKHAEGDPVPEIRALALATLHKSFHGAVTDGALRGALEDPSSLVRAAAARALPAPATLLAIVLERRAAPELRADCLRTLATLPAHGLGADHLLALLQEPNTLVRQAAIRVFPTADPERARAELPTWPTPKEHAERLALTEALGRLRSPAAEARLLELLADPERDVRLQAVRGLAETGTVLAVAGLRVASDEAFGLGDVAEAATAAILRVQGRAGNAEAGQLSLSEHAGREGAVALAGGTVGAVGVVVTPQRS